MLNGNGTVTFTPNANFNGAASFTYKATDGTAQSNTATVMTAYGVRSSTARETDGLGASNTITKLRR